MKIRLNFPIFMEEGEFLYNFLENIYFCYSIETKAAFDIFFPYRRGKLIRMEIKRKYIFFYNKYINTIVFRMISISTNYFDIFYSYRNTRIFEE